jgi:hypothetical protein
MNSVTLSNILWSAAPDQGFAIYGIVNNETDYNDKVVYNDPTKKPSWATVQAGQDPEQWKVVRSERNGKLQASDWSVLPDVPVTPEKKTEWENYRQALRDVTNQPDPFNITWPTPPE